MFACNLRTTVPLCLQIETFKPGLYFKLQEGTEQSKPVMSTTDMCNQGQVGVRWCLGSSLLFSTDLSQNAGRACVRALLPWTGLSPTGVEQWVCAQLAGTFPSALGSICRWQMPSSGCAPCQLPLQASSSALRGKPGGEGNVLLLPTAGLLEKILPAPADFITSLPEDPKVPGPRGEGKRGGEPGRGCRMAGAGPQMRTHLWGFGSLPRFEWQPCQK